MAGLLKNGWSTGLNERGVNAAENRMLKRSHEYASFAMRTNIFSEDIADYLDGYPEKKRQMMEVSEEVRKKGMIAWKVIKKSDGLASAFDRWQVSELHELGEKYRKSMFEVKSVYLLNPFSGDLIKSEIPKNVSLTEFEDMLYRIWRVTNNLSLKYSLFYAIYEPMFYEKVVSSPSPADTRTPTHTVFDHLYACAAVINWLCSDAIAKKEELHPRGLLVRVDLAGVQDFIGASRKLRDLWFSSWLASSLLFKTIEELIEHIGPDILIRPTARHNPFYYNLLLRWLEREKVPEDIRKELEEIAKKYAGLENWPQYAVIPATIDLILPPYEVLSQLLGKEIHDKGKLIEYFYGRYISYWKELVNVLKEGVKGLKIDGELKERLEKAIEKMNKYRVEDSPPFIMRVVIVSVPEELSDEERKQERLYYCSAFKRLNDNFKAIQPVKIHPACFTNLTEMTEDMWRSMKEYRVCTICGKFPSVLDIPYREEHYFKVVPQEFQVYLDLGEHLCPYCLIKRLATHHTIFGRVTEKLIGCKERPLSFPSTSSVATYPFMRGLIEAQNDTYVKNAVKRILEKLKYPRLPSTYWQALRELMEDIEVEDIKRFLQFDAELTLLPEEMDARREVEELRRAVEKSVKDILDPVFTRINTYYAIVRADGDYVESLFAGYLNRETMGIDYMELLASSIDNIPDQKAKKFARLLIEGANNNVHVVERILRSELGQGIVKEVKETAERVCKLLSEIRDKGELPVTPAYHAMLSRALMITALRDIEVIQKDAKGVVIYAGGDDFLAFVPSTFVLDLVYKTRRHYSIGDLEHRGFHKLGDGYFVSLGKASRSYSVIFSHFKYPMNQLLKLSYEFLKSAKKMRTIHEAFGKSKDILLLAYCPRGGGIKAKSAIPLSFEKPIRLLMMLINGIENGPFSHSLIYDLLMEMRSYGEKTQQFRAFELLENLLDYLLDRNLTVRNARPTAKLLASELRELAGYMVFDGEECRVLLEQIVYALWANIVALRGREL
jgi:CRISPR-associated protein Cmr2